MKTSWEFGDGKGCAVTLLVLAGGFVAVAALIAYGVGRVV